LPTRATPGKWSQIGAWTVYCRCARCDDARVFEVDNEARERAIGLPPWPKGDKKRT
jgi:hypothetical protein